MKKNNSLLIESILNYTVVILIPLLLTIFIFISSNINLNVKKFLFAYNTLNFPVLAQIFSGNFHIYVSTTIIFLLKYLLVIFYINLLWNRKKLL
jgi:hypothetical protein